MSTDVTVKISWPLPPCDEIVTEGEEEVRVKSGVGMALAAQADAFTKFSALIVPRPVARS